MLLQQTGRSFSLPTISVCRVKKKTKQKQIFHTSTSSALCLNCPPTTPCLLQMESSSVAKTKNDKAWRKVSEEIKRIFRAAVLLLQEKGTMTSIQAKKFLCSGKSQVNFLVPSHLFT